jgi:aminomethyltransferase
MKRTAFYDIHRALNAKLVDFAGFEMPVQYSGIIEEHTTVRTAVGLFDVSHMGEFEVAGPDALALVQRVTTNDAAKLSPGKAQYSAMCYEDGGIVDDLLVYCRGEKYMLVVNAANIEKDFAWIGSHAGGLQAKLTNRSDEYSLLAVQGPRSLDTLRPLTKADLAAIVYYGFVEGEVAGVPCIISRTGYTGELGFELYFESSRSAGEKVWHAIMESGAQFGIRPIGLGARDTLRLEMGFCLYGNDIDKSTNPLEAGLGWITKLDKGEFIGKETLASVKQRGLKRKLVGFVVDAAKALPRHGYEIYGGEASAGVVTSGTISPVLEKGIGMGYVEASLSQPATAIQILVRSNHVGAHVVKLPFISK